MLKEPCHSVVAREGHGDREVAHLLKEEEGMMQPKIASVYSNSELDSASP